jgi:DNA-binding MarR family transcriptional regulator
MKPEETIDFHIKYTWQSIVKMYNEVAKPFEMSMASGHVLLNIDIENGTPSSSLGPQMGMEATSLSRVIKNLEDKGWIQRRKNPLDGRGSLVFLTPSGLEKRKQAREAVIHFNQVVKNHLGENRLRNLLSELQEVQTLITTQNIYQDVL